MGAGFVLALAFPAPAAADAAALEGDAGARILRVADDFNVHMNGGWWAVMMLGMVIFWAVVVVAIVWAVRVFGTGAPAPESRQTPLELLERRFAEGSISLEEYEERRSVLLASTVGEVSGEGPQPIARQD